MTEAQRKRDRGVASQRRSPWWARLGFSALIVAAGCNFPGEPKPIDAEAVARRESSFSALYSRHCAACHGAEGKLGAAPPLNDGLFRAIVPREQVELVISQGRAGTPMPAFGRQEGGPLSDDELTTLVRGIKGEPADGVSDSWPKPAKAPDTAPPYVVASQQQRLSATELESIRKTTFAQACGECHGAHGEGSEAGPINDVAFLQLFSDQGLRRIIITGRPDLGMPDFADAHDRGADFKPLSGEQVDQLVALLAHWRGQPPTASALTKE